MSDAYEKAFSGTLGVLGAISSVLLVSLVIHAAIRWASRVDPGDAGDLLQRLAWTFGPIIGAFLIVALVIKRWLWRRY